MAEREYERLSENLISAADVKAGWIAIATRFKQRTLAVAPRCALFVAVESEIDACHDIIEAFSRESLAELAATEVGIDD